MDLGEILDNPQMLDTMSLGEVLEAAYQAKKTGNKSVMKKIQMNLQSKLQSQANIKTEGIPHALKMFMAYSEKITDQDLVKALNGGAIKLVETMIYSTICIQEQTKINLFANGVQNKFAGRTNLNTGKLDKGNVLLLQAIQVLTSIDSVDSTLDNGANSTFTTPMKQVINGHFIFKSDTETMIDRTGSYFFQRGTTEVPGLWKLETPILINAQKTLEFELELSGVAPLKSFARVNLYGLMTKNK